ncbi:MAG: TolB-like 6-bladed beta-propeller domain-containing protein [Bacteroidales bacterium]|nr:TolB-like 6-bladed beta-propeller domain-containing protein [Bacteroidales bacterium]
MTVFKPILPIIVLAGLLSCSEPAGLTLTLDNVEYVNVKSKKGVVLEVVSNEPVDFDIMGVVDVKVWKDWLLFATMKNSGYISIFDKGTSKPLGKFLANGNGPGELSETVSFGEISFDGDIAAINDSKGELIYWDIKTSCETGNTVCLDSISKVIGAGYLTSIVPVMDNALACVRVVKFGQERFLYKGGEMIVTPTQQKLNDVKLSVNDGFRFNMLFGFAAYNKDLKRMAEVSTMLNTIQIYGLDDSFAKTVCIGKRPDDVSYIEKMPLADLPVSFQSLKSFEFGFGLLYCGTTMLDSQTTRLVRPDILVFDWDGKLIMRYEVPVWITAFDVDWDSRIVYGVDFNEDQIYKFALPE